MNETVVTLREKPQLLHIAASRFHEKRGLPAEAYRACTEYYPAAPSTAGISAREAMRSSGAWA